MAISGDYDIEFQSLTSEFFPLAEEQLTDATLVKSVSIFAKFKAQHADSETINSSRFTTFNFCTEKLPENDADLFNQAKEFVNAAAKSEEEASMSPELLAARGPEGLHLMSFDSPEAQELIANIRAEEKKTSIERVREACLITFKDVGDVRLDHLQVEVIYFNQPDISEGSEYSFVWDKHFDR
jgi:hypothetical protein